jgi:hypothetical protein
MEYVPTSEKNRIKTWIWIYVFFLLFEGVFRKWIFPSQSNLFFIIRDPVAAIIIIMSLKRYSIPFKPFIFSLIGVGIASFMTALLFGHGSLLVALFGLRPFILHFPLAFVIGTVFNKSDVLKLGRFMIFLLPFMTLLAITQFYSPQSSWVNRGVGGDLAGAGFGGALGYFRPPGTFSFINGLALYYGLSSAFLFYFMLNPKYISKYILIVGIVSTLLSIPFSISRTVFFQDILCFSFFIFPILKRPTLLKRISIIFLLSILLILIFKDRPIITTPINAFTSRFESASISEGGLKGTLIDRVFVTLWDALLNSPDVKTFGVGLGANSNVGVNILDKSKDIALYDYEWYRMIYEIGPILGILFIFIRIVILAKIIKIAIMSYRNHQFLPWMLLSFGFLLILQGQIAQPTSLGFITLIIGLLIASCKNRDSQLNYQRFHMNSL